jgi:group I intron endonuclease
VGSAVDLSKRLSHYFNKSYLTKYKSMYIYKVLLQHGYSSFSLTILEYIDISNLSKKDTRKLILERKQHYIESLVPEYNINPIAESRLGSIQTEETKEKLSQAMKSDNNPRGMLGRVHSAKVITKISKALVGKTLSTETIAKISKAKTGESHPFYGKSHTLESRLKISIANKGIAKSKEHKNKLRVPKTEEHKAKISALKSQYICLFDR